MQRRSKLHDDNLEPPGLEVSKRSSGCTRRWPPSAPGWSRG